MEQSLYAEAGCKPKKQGKDYLLTAGVGVMGVIAAFLILFTGNMIMGIIGVALVVGIIFLYPRLSVEYEYIFCDGQLDFDKIFSGNKRKTAMKIDMDNVEVVGKPEEYKVKDFKTVQTIDFSSRQHPEKTYAIVLNKEDKLIKILFEPSERMLEAMKNKAPRKVIKGF